MNQVSAFNPATANPLTAPLEMGFKIVEGVHKQLAQGLTGLFSNPLGAGPNAGGKLPGHYEVKCGPRHHCIPPRDHCHPGHHHHHHGPHGHHHHGPRFPLGGGLHRPTDCGFGPRPRPDDGFNPGNGLNRPTDCGWGRPKPLPFPGPIGIPMPKPDTGFFPGGGCIPQYPKPGCWDIKDPAVKWSTQMTGEGTAKIDLGDGYKLDINEKNSEMTIINEKTGEKTRIWGDPHVDVDGKRAFDFWGTSTFTLENGTKITINTEQWKGNPNMYVASQVFITKGDNAIVVDGISQNKLGDLKVTMSNDGKAVDAANRDGWTLHENKTGSGWRTEAGNIATQKDADVTKVGAEYGPGSKKLSEAEFDDLIDGFENFDFGQLVGQIGNFLTFGSIVNSLVGMATGDKPAAGVRDEGRAYAGGNRHFNEAAGSFGPA